MNWPTRTPLHDERKVAVTFSDTTQANGKQLKLIRLSVPHVNPRLHRVDRLHFVDISLNMTEDVLTGPGPVKVEGIWMAHVDLIVDACIRMLGPDTEWRPWRYDNHEKTRRRVTRMITLGFAFQREALVDLEELLNTMQAEITFHWDRQSLSLDLLGQHSPVILEVPHAALEKTNRVLRFFTMLFTQDTWPDDLGGLWLFVTDVLRDIRIVHLLYERYPPVHSCEPCI